MLFMFVFTMVAILTVMHRTWVKMTLPLYLHSLGLTYVCTLIISINNWM